MSNIHGLHTNRRDSSSADGGDDDDGGADDSNNRYVGGVDSRGGGSGLAVQPNASDVSAGGGIFDSIRTSAASASASDGPVRRTITMYRDGFTVDDGPYRSVTDPSNSEFLSALARGRTPRELAVDDEGNSAAGGGNVAVGLVDKRNEDYVPPSGGGGGGGSAPAAPAFRSFSGEGTSLGTSSEPSSRGGVVTPGSAATSSSSTPPRVDASRPATSVQIRLINGRRMIVRLNVDSPVSDLVRHIEDSGDGGSDPYVLTTGYPPRTLEDLSRTVGEEGLGGSQVVQKRA